MMIDPRHQLYAQEQIREWRREAERQRLAQQQEHTTLLNNLGQWMIDSGQWLQQLNGTHTRRPLERTI